MTSVTTKTTHHKKGNLAEVWWLPRDSRGSNPFIIRESGLRRLHPWQPGEYGWHLDSAATAFSGPDCWRPDHGNRDILRSGDIESNPGPLGSCVRCGGNFTPHSRPILCAAGCGRQTHRKVVCSGLRGLEAQRLGSWRCGCDGGAGQGQGVAPLAPVNPMAGGAGRGQGVAPRVRPAPPPAGTLRPRQRRRRTRTYPCLMQSRVSRVHPRCTPPRRTAARQKRRLSAKRRRAEA